jgi:hypothetical protein
MADLTAAQTYLSTYSLYTTAWDAADTATRTKALNQAENEIARLPWRSNAPADNITYATYEQAAFLLETQSEQSRANLQAQGVSHAGVTGGAYETYRQGANRYGFALSPGAQKWTRGWLVVQGTVR